MFNEPSSTSEDMPIRAIIPDGPEISAEQRRYEQQVSELREIVDTIMEVERQIEPDPDDEDTPKKDLIVINPDAVFLITFKGRLRLDSIEAYDRLDALLAPKNMIPLFRKKDGNHYIHIFEGRLEIKPRRRVVNLILFLLTFVAVMYTGTIKAINEIAAENIFQAIYLSNNIWSELWRGLPYAISILLILGAHELGHYFAARRHKIAVTLPYFIPFPFGIFGTFGAFIQLREPMRNRRTLFDIGAAGPIAGLIFAVPILFIGLATSTTGPITPGGLVEGNSVFYALAKFVTFGEFLPNGVSDVYVNQLAWAGWTGLFVTGLNLIPIGQLDGGHVMYSLIGKQARRLYIPVVFGLVALMVITQNFSMVFIVLMIFLLGRIYAVPLDDITELDPSRRWMAVATLVIFLLVFVPVPLEQTPFSAQDMNPPGTRSAYLPFLTALLIVTAGRLRARLGL